MVGRCGVEPLAEAPVLQTFRSYLLLNLPDLVGQVGVEPTKPLNFKSSECAVSLKGHCPI